MYILKIFGIALVVVLPMNIISEVFRYWMYRVGKEIKSESPELYKTYLSSSLYPNTQFPYNQQTLSGSTKILTNIAFKKLIVLGKETSNPSLVSMVKTARIFYWLLLMLVYSAIFYWLFFFNHGIWY